MQSTPGDAAWNTLETLGAALQAPPSAPGDAPAAPVHTLYGGAQRFKAGTLARLGELAVTHLEAYAPDAAALSAALQWPSGADDELRYQRLVHKLRCAPIEDFRVDFEDGYGERGDADEDAQAVRVGEQVAIAWEKRGLTPFFGLRVKALTPRHWRRAARTLELFCTAVARAGVPDSLRVTVPKVEHQAQVLLAVAMCARVEQSLGWPPETLQLELMVESPAALCDAHGVHPLRMLVEAAAGRCRAVHFGAYDYLAVCGVTAVSAGLRHPACDLARGLMRLALAGTPVHLADGATQVLPLPRHASPATAAQRAQNAQVIHAAWRLHADNVTHALHQGFYQGWDLHPAQLIARHAAVIRFFCDSLPGCVRRLGAFLDQAATAATAGEFFDDAASAWGLMRFFRQGLACGALGEGDIAPLRLTPAAFQQPDLHALVRLRQAPPT